MEVGECGSMLISGIAKSGRFAGTGSYAAPVADTGTFQLGDSGFPVIFQGEDYIVMNLGGGGGGIAESNGFFTVEDATTSSDDGQGGTTYERAVRIFDSRMPDSNVAGAVNLSNGPSVWNIPVTRYVLTTNQSWGINRWLYLKISYSTQTRTYSYEFKDFNTYQRNANDYVFYILIAEVQMKNTGVSILRQYYRSNMPFEMASVSWV